MAGPWEKYAEPIIGVGPWSRYAPEQSTPVEQKSVENVIATTPDGGRIIKTENGLSFASPGYSTNDPDAIARIMEGATIKQEVQSGFDRDVIGQHPIAARGSKVLQGIPFAGQYLDEFAGAVAGDRSRDGVRTVQEAMDRQHPVQSTALQIGGGIAAAIPAAMAAAPAAIAAAPATLGAQIATGAAVGVIGGGVEGAVSGYGAGNNGDRGRSAIVNGAIGAGLGGALGGAAPAAAAGIRSLLQRLRGSEVSTISKSLSISADAAKVVKRALDQEDIGAAISALDRAGPRAMLADAGPAAQNLLDASVQYGGAAPREIRGAISGRANESAGAAMRALDDALGKPEGAIGLVDDIRNSTRGARKSAYDAAYDVEIDWRSPAGEKLRGLIDTTPDEALGAAARTRAMSARPEAIPESAYPEFAPQSYTASGDMPGVAADRADVGAFFGAYNEANAPMMKRPFTDQIRKAGGIDPTSPAARELYARGITPKTTPGLFRKGGLQDLDNLELSQMPESLRFSAGDGTGNYASRDDVLNSLISEYNGQPVRSAADEQSIARSAEMEQMLPEYQNRLAKLQKTDAQRAAMPTAPNAPSELVPTKTVRDIDLIKRALDDIDRSNDGMGKLGGQTTYGMEAGKRAREIRDALAEVSPGYKTALETAADPIRRVESVKFGTQVLRSGTTREEVFRQVRKSTPAEKAALAQGIRSNLDETLANVKAYISQPDSDVAEFRRLVRDLSSRANRDKIRIVIGPEKAAKLSAALDQEVTSLEMQFAIAANSKTAGRQGIRDSVSAQTAPGILGTLAQGEPVNFGKRIVQTLTAQTPEAVQLRQMGIYDEIGRALISKRGADAKAALTLIQRAQSGAAVSEPQARLIARAVGSSLAIGGYQSGSQILGKQ